MASIHLPIHDEPELPSAALPGDGRRHAIQPADVRGRFHRARTGVFALLVVFWAALPWVQLGDRVRERLVRLEDVVRLAG